MLLIITLGGLLLRGWGVFSISMTHYDEYYYAQSGVWVVVDHQAAEAVLTEAQEVGNVVGTPPARLAMLHPMQPLHAPILYPTLCGIAYWLHGAPWYAAGACVSAVLGTATIPLVYAIGR